jgi:transcriptional regulator with XRE-family HTH domain
MELKESTLKIRSARRFPIYFNLEHDGSFFDWTEAFLDNEHKPVFPIILDNHRDLAEVSRDDKQVLEMMKTSGYDVELIERGKADLEITNENFIKMALELGIVQDLLLICPKNEVHSNENRYQDIDGFSHRIFYLTYLDDLINPDDWGALKDKHDPKALEIQKRLDDMNPILDIDLDYFIYHRDNDKFVIHDNNFKKIFSVLRDLMIERFIFSRIKGLVISLEPEYCNGPVNCKEIFTNVLDFLTEGMGLIDADSALKIKEWASRELGDS